MDLIFWRHADAEGGAPDLARKLTPLGHAQATRVAAWLQPRLPANYKLLASPALRAQQTALALKSDLKIIGELAPGASVEAILKTAGNEGTVVVVGHQPDLGHVLAFLLCGEERDWSVAKGALWWIANRTAVRAVVSPDLL